MRCQRDLQTVRARINGPCARQGAKNTLKNLLSEANNVKRKERKERKEKKKTQGFMIRGKATPNTLAQVRLFGFLRFPPVGKEIGAKA